MQQRALDDPPFGLGTRGCTKTLVNGALGNPRALQHRMLRVNDASADSESGCCVRVHQSRTPPTQAAASESIRVALPPRSHGPLRVVRMAAVARTAPNRAAAQLRWGSELDIARPP